MKVILANGSTRTAALTALAEVATMLERMESKGGLLIGASAAGCMAWALPRDRRCIFDDAVNEFRASEQVTDSFGACPLAPAAAPSRLMDRLFYSTRAPDTD
ncbi:MAG: hypothetical protein ACLT5H_10480 [Collinsella stercoris]|uniref:hypothetical protein n=1 Tax=Collinsella stercoris TaxID=147206 RepID=UPI003995A5A6